MLKGKILMVSVGIATIALLAGDQLKQFINSISFYISSIGVPRFSRGFMELPVFISFVNQSNFSFSIEQIMTTFYKWENNTWSNIGMSDPQNDPMELSSGKTTNIRITPRIAILQGVISSVFSLLRQGGVKYRIGVSVKVGGRFLPEQYEEISIGQIQNAI